MSTVIVGRRTSEKSDEIVSRLRVQLPSTKNAKRARAELEREELAAGLYSRPPPSSSSSSSSSSTPSIPYSSTTTTTSLPAHAKRARFVPREPCKFFASGTCQRGEQCTYSHQLHLFPCRHTLHGGVCPDEPTCPFSHARRVVGGGGGGEARVRSAYGAVVAPASIPSTTLPPPYFPASTTSTSSSSFTTTTTPGLVVAGTMEAKDDRAVETSVHVGSLYDDLE